MRVPNQLSILLAHVLVTVGGLKVKVSEGPLTILGGEFAVLQCQAALAGDRPLEHMAVQWLRSESRAVVHSYYRGADQPKLQSAQYTGRTSLFPGELTHGNVSLKLQAPKPSDAGKYECHVSTLMESDEQILSVKFAAYYTEPTLEIDHGVSGFRLSLRSEGYPEADVTWFRGEGKLQPVLSHTVYRRTSDSLYSLRSVVVTNGTDARDVQYTVVLTNAAVKQTITRTVRLLGVDYPAHQLESSCLYPALLAISAIPLLAIIALVTWSYRRRQLQGP